MTARRRPRRLGVLSALAGMLLGALLPRVATADSDAWTLEGSGLLAFPVAPEAFHSGWRAGWGLAGSMHRSVGARTDVGLEGSYAQFGLGDLAGGAATGGTRRWSSLRVPLRMRLWEHERRHDAFGLSVSAGYTHQSIEPIGNIGQPPKTGGADGFAASAGLRYSHPLHLASRFSIGLEYTAAFFADETPGALFLRFGLVTPLEGSSPPP